MDNKLRFWQIDHILFQFISFHKFSAWLNIDASLAMAFALQTLNYSSNIHSNHSSNIWSN